MKIRILLSTLALFICQLSMAQVILNNQITDSNPSSANPFTAGQTYNPNVTVSGIGRGPGINPNAATNRYNANSWNSSSIDLNDYFEFTITPNASFNINFTSFTFTGQASGTGPTNVAFRSSADDYATNIGSADVTGPNTISLAGAAYQNITTPITFRLYAWGASAQPGTFSVNDFLFLGTVTNCVATNTITPASGPVGTELTITATSNNLTGATVIIGGVSAAVTQISSTVIKATVPAGAATGTVVTTNSLGCSASNPFTVISSVIGSCQGSGSSRPQIFISEITDHSSGSHNYVELFNATGAPVNLSGYTIAVHNNGSGTPTGVITLPSYSLAHNTAYVVAFGATTGAHGGITANYVAPPNSLGVNNDDHIRLYNNGGTWIDLWGDTSGNAYTVSNGNFYYRRKNTGITAPSTTWNASDWTAGTPVSYTDVGSYSFAAGSPPVVTLQPFYTPSCSSVSFTVAANEGFAGGNPLAYQWYVAAPGATIWTALTNTGVYSGATTPTLTISNIAGLADYQYYSQVRENGVTCYSASNAVKVIGIQTSTWNGSAWTPAAPDATTIVVINGNFNTGTHGNIDACSLTVNGTRTLTVNAPGYVSIQNNLTVNTGGTLVVQNDASLVMINDLGVVTNNGTMQVQRTTTPYRRYDYTYWSSPIVAANIGTTFPGWRTDYSFSFATENFSDLTGPLGVGPADGFDDDNNAWIPAPAGSTMVPGKGYAIMTPTTGTFPATSTVTFSGRVNNGVITIPLALSGNPANNNDDFNLIGNPYPSALSADDFITQNTNISGTLYFWTHLTPLTANNFNNDDYAMYNLSGGTQSGSGSSIPTGEVASGQGFFVDANVATNLVFNNSMRNKAYANDDFFRSASQVQSGGRDRIWLNLTHSAGLLSQQLVGYFDQATLGFDRGYDGLINPTKNTISFYSLIEGSHYRIQGRPAFSVTDVVPLGYKSAVADTFVISIENVEGQLANESTDIYLFDNTTGLFHNLKQSDFVFNTAAGVFNERFELRYTDALLANPEHSVEQQLVIASNEQQLAIRSPKAISTVRVFDILGRMVYSQNDVNANEFSTRLNIAPQVVIVKVTLDDGTQVDRKVMM